METIVDGVHRQPENGIKVVIIGAGVGGLQAALECWRKGCDVVVLEKADKLSPIGDYFTITPSALTTLKEYPSMHADYHQCVYDCSIHIFTPAGRPIYSTVPEWKRPGAAHGAPDVDVSFLKRRPVYVQMQFDQATRLGIPILWNEKVVSVREQEHGVTVTTDSGQELTCDICIGANGIGSTIPGFHAGPDITVQDSGYAVARVAFPRSFIKDGSPASSLIKNVHVQPEFRTYVGRDVHLILFLTQDWVAIAFTHPDHDSAKESWSHLIGSEELIPYLEQTNDDWDPAVLDFVRSAPSGIVDWKLRWRDGTPQWTSEMGRLVRLGDAAHAFFPTAGNGAVQALEDAVSLAECLHVAGKERVRNATRVHNKLRFERVSILQQTGFLNREELHNVDITALTEGSHDASVGFFKMGRWVWGHNPETYARDNFESCLAHLEEGNSFTNTNVPPGHIYLAWDLDSENRRREAGMKSTLKQNGDWSA